MKARKTFRRFARGAVRTPVVKTTRIELPTLFSTLALGISVASFYISWDQHQRSLAEHQPVLAARFIEYGEGRRYGIVLRNISEGRLKVNRFAMKYAGVALEGQGRTSFRRLNVDTLDYQKITYGYGDFFVKGEEYPVLTMSKDLTKSQQQDWRVYISSIRGELCYCTATDSPCWMSYFVLSQTTTYEVNDCGSN